MAQLRPPARQGPLAGQPSSVQVTVVPEIDREPRLRRLAGRAPARRYLSAGLAVAAAAVATVGTAVSEGGRSHAARSAGVPGARIDGPAGVAAAYQYPLGCLSVTVDAADRAYARAWLDRASPCWRYGAYVTAIFHRVDGTWQIILNTTTYSCPVASLPAVVQAQLSVCTRPR